ncbi:GUN4 domain-containing protein [Microcoleus sp. Pol8_D6]
MDLVRGIPRAEAVIRGIAKYDLPEISKLSAEMVYQIANIYGFNLQEPERKIEALTAFGAAFLGERAIEAGIDWLEYGMIPSKIISAAAKALMIYAVGHAACMFYEAKLNQHINPLTSPTVINKIREQSQHYLDNATSEEEILALISREINTVLTIDYTRLSSLLKAGEWKKADQETCDIIVKIANRDFEGNLRILPRDDLHTINQLWSQNSNGHFGFKAQKQIYSDVSKKVGDFGEKIGWRRDPGIFGGIFAWKSYGALTFNLNNAPKGHLPAFPLDMPWWYHKGETTRDFAQSILERNDW